MRCMWGITITLYETLYEIGHVWRAMCFHVSENDVVRAIAIQPVELDNCCQLFMFRSSCFPKLNPQSTSPRNCCTV